MIWNLSNSKQYIQRLKLLDYLLTLFFFSNNHTTNKVTHLNKAMLHNKVTHLHHHNSIISKHLNQYTFNKHHHKRMTMVMVVWNACCVAVSLNCAVIWWVSCAMKILTWYQRVQYWISGYLQMTVDISLLLLVLRNVLHLNT